MHMKEIEEGIAAKKSEEEIQNKSGVNIKKDPVIIEYEDMSEHQKKIVDAGMDDEHVTTVPSHLSDEELTKWIFEQINKVGKKNG